MSRDAQEPMDDLMQDLMGDFLDESAGLLTQLSERLLQLDNWAKGDAAECSQPLQPELLNEMFRAAHSLKGLSGMLRLDDINSLTHRVENILDAARNGDLAVTGDVVDVVFRAIDRLELMISLLNDCDRTTVDCGAVLQAIDQILVDSGTARAVSSQKDVELAWGSLQAASNGAAPQAAVTQLNAADASDPLAGIADDKDTPAKYLAIFVDEGQMTLDSISDAHYRPAVASVSSRCSSAFID